MAYEYKKLSEVDAVESVDSSVNLLVEQGSDIKKMNIGDLPIPTGQVQADWNEEDGTKPSFIKNKPDLSQVGGGSGGEVIVINVDYMFQSPDWHYADGTVITPESLRDKLNEGATVYISRFESGLGDGTQSANTFYRVNHFSYHNSYTNMSGFYEKSKINLVFVVSEYISSLSKHINVFKSLTCFGD